MIDKVNLIPKNTRSQYLKMLLNCLIFLTLSLLSPPVVHGIVDPISFPNNKFGIHIISPTPGESSPAASLVNSNGGDWGYITIIIQSTDRNEDKWRTFFNDLRKRHLIPIVRLATHPEGLPAGRQGPYWKRPYEGEEEAWADFLDKLNWPIRNRYVTIYNEPNQGYEWGNVTDPKSYAQTLDKTISALKKKSSDFFVLNSGFDASAPNEPPKFMDEVGFIYQMEKEVPGIFEKLDGWVSHSYPNPGFVGSAYASGRGTTSTWRWELQLLNQLGVKKQLPVFITETGWKHAEGKDYDKTLPSSTTSGEYLKYAFTGTWVNNQIVAITPFLLDYQDSPFDHFSFKKYQGGRQDIRILGSQYPDYYPLFDAIQGLNKQKGKPDQVKEALLTKGEVYSSVVVGETYEIPLSFKNIGQSIWNDQDHVYVKIQEGSPEFGVFDIPVQKKVEPSEEIVINLKLSPKTEGVYKLKLNFFEGEKEFNNKPIEYIINIKQPVILKVISKLKWKQEFSGEYLLKLSTYLGEKIQNLIIGADGTSGEIEAKFLLPSYDFDFTLEKPFYKPKRIKQRVVSGLNNLDFGTLEPDFFQALFEPRQFWYLLPISN